MDTTYQQLNAIKKNLPDGTVTTGPDTLETYNAIIRDAESRMGKSLQRFLITLDDVKPYPEYRAEGDPPRYMCIRSHFVTRLEEALQYFG